MTQQLARIIIILASPLFLLLQGCSSNTAQPPMAMEWEVYAVFDREQALPVRVTTARKLTEGMGIRYDYMPHSVRVKGASGSVVEIRFPTKGPSDWIATEYFEDGREKSLRIQRIFEGEGYPKASWTDNRLQEPIPLD